MTYSHALKGMVSSAEYYAEKYSIEILRELYLLALRTNRIHHRIAIEKAIELKKEVGIKK